MSDAVQDYPLGSFRYRCQLCRERFPRIPNVSVQLWRKSIPLCDHCQEWIARPGAKRVVKLLKVSMRVGRPVSQLTYRRQFRRRFGFAALKCQCGCGQYTRTDARFLAGHEPDSETFEEMHRRLIAEPQRYPDDLIAKANQLYEEGLSTLAVARRLRVSQAWVHKATNTLSPKDARSLGVKRPRGGGKNRKELPVAAIIADYDNGRGLEPRALANKYGVSHATIRNRLREAGVYRLLWHQ